MQMVAQYKRIPFVKKEADANDGNEEIDQIPVGLVIAVKDDFGDVVFGWSACDDEDAFDKKEAMKIAKGRALNHSVKPIPSSISDVVDDKFLARVEAYFKQEVKPPKMFVMSSGKKRLATFNKEKTLIELPYDPKD